MNLMKGQQLIPLEEKTCNLGEMYQYDFEKFIRFTLIVFQLVDLAQRESVEMCITLDGAELCDGISHLTAGIKVTDPRAIDPRDGSPLCLNNVENYGRIFNNQSRNYCFAMQSLIGKDTKSAYQEFVVVAHGKLETHIFATCAHAVEIQWFVF
jgi:hypothetical protein